MKSRILFLFITLFILIFNSHIYSSVKKFDINNWKKSLIDYRHEKDIEFKTSPTSPMAGYLRITLKKEQRIFIVIKKDKVFGVQHKPDNYSAVFFEKDDSWFFKKFGNEHTLKLSGYKTLKIDKFTVGYYPLKKSLVLAIFDPYRDKIKEFKHLLYFPPDIKYRVKGKFIKFKDPEKISIPTSKNLQKNFFRYAKIKFEIDGKKLELTVLKSSIDPKNPDSKYLFIPFADKTSDVETYGGGRFIEMPEPEGDNIILDFNYCFNPLCNYADVYNCTLPPFENELDIEIKAGEKTYPH
jgi:uncharacterized protein (DUF1684 family)